MNAMIFSALAEPHRLAIIELLSAGPLLVGNSDQEGNIVRASFSATFPLEIYNHLTLTETEGKTTITLRGGPINVSDEELNFFKGMFDSMKQGFGATFDQLDEYLAKV
ncbi:SRPBCC domain-containing protein [Paenibacillus sp. 19GGS1-52]|uniref:SRPBCC domain-containing protein n=1 Tax=Paenibacillus sp. 19GGS1-52 TaxID=2758563 RepID=UPI001EFABD02|nr:SRPBCC domain-containing protein [Paenibacillus sp. 19GGS1-52]